MSYEIHLMFQSDVPTSQLAGLMQGMYDLNGVDGMFFINNEQPGDRYAHFHRETEDDIEYIHARLPKGVYVTDEMLIKAAGEQLLAELTVYDSAEALDPIINAIREGKFTLKCVEELRPVMNERYAESIIGDHAQNYDALEIHGVRDLAEKTPLYRNHYRCKCGTQWSDEWDCMCNDHCPACDKEIEPYNSDDLSSTACEVDNENPQFFSVYAHLKEGGVECVGDFGKHLLAEQYAKELSMEYGWPVHDFVKTQKQRLAA